MPALVAGRPLDLYAAVVASPRASLRSARRWHLLTAAVVAFALAFQLVCWSLTGSAILLTAEPPSMAERLVRFVSYFTVLSNVLVLIAAVTLARAPMRDGRVWRVLRLNAVVGITVTGIIHFFFLRPLLDLPGAPYVADKLLHVVVPVLAVGGWIAFGPAPTPAPPPRSRSPHDPQPTTSTTPPQHPDQPEERSVADR